MTVGPPGGGAHRARRTRVDVVRVLLAPLAAVAAVAGLIAVLLYLNGEPEPKGAPVVARSGDPASSAVTLPTESLRPIRPTASTASARPTSPAPTRTATAAPATPVVRAPLTVLNNSRRSGLATRAAAEFERGGWDVVRTGNFTGRIAETTVYFAPGQEPAAQSLARQFSGIKRVRPRFEGLPGSGLTVVLTRDWPG